MKLDQNIADVVVSIILSKMQEQCGLATARVSAAQACALKGDRKGALTIVMDVEEITFRINRLFESVRTVGRLAGGRSDLYPIKGDAKGGISNPQTNQFA